MEQTYHEPIYETIDEEVDRLTHRLRLVYAELMTKIDALERRVKELEKEREST